MLGRNSSEPRLFQMVNLDELIPANHRLRKIDAVLNLDFVHEVVAERYVANRGRPSVDPELVLRMMLLGELYDLSDRELCDEIAMHAGFRWFCRLNFDDPVPDHSTLSRLRNERWAKSGVWERLRDEVLGQCSEAGLLSGKHLSLDGTQIEADASIKSVKRIGPTRVPDQDPEDPDPAGGTRRVKEPQAKGSWRGHGEKFSNGTHRSTTDPDARLYRKGEAAGAKLSYLAHDLIDTKSRVVLRRRASLATSIAEREIGLELLDEVLDVAPALLPNAPEVLTADGGYGASEFVADVLDRGLDPHIPLQSGAAMEPLPTWKRRPYTLKEARARRERLRLVRARNRTRELHTTRGYQVSRKLRIRSEHLFAEAKGQHGLGRTRRRQLERQTAQMELSATVQNLKRLIAFRGRPRKAAGVAILKRSRQRRASLSPSPWWRCIVFLAPRAPSWRIIARTPFRAVRVPHSSTDF